jgi:hypothetical protein
MIEGLHYDVPSEKIHDILIKRIEQCDKKAEMFQRQGEQQKALSAQIADDAGADSPKFSGDQSTNLLTRAKEYQEKSKMYRFLVEHLVKDTYRLSHEDLRFLGVIDRNVY